MLGLRRRQDILAILPTNAGKSMLWAIAARIDTAATLVVLPLRSLMEDQKRRLQAMSVSFEQYHAELDISPGTRLILVSADQAQTPTFRRKMQTFFTHTPLGRVVLDEVHVHLTQSDFRKVLVRLARLRMGPYQLVALSATLPPKAEPHLLDALGMDKDSAVVLREATNRKELKFTLLPPAPWKQIRAMVDTWRDIHLHDSEPHDAMLCFVNSKNVAESFAEQFKTEFYAAGSDDAVLHRWRQATRGTLMATNALSAGYDHPHVRYVMTAGPPLPLLETVQEMGRGGRDGKKCIVVLQPIDHPPPRGATPDDLAGEVESYEMYYKSGRRCIRHRITSFTDGEDLAVMCSEPGNQLCSICEKVLKLPGELRGPGFPTPQR